MTYYGLLCELQHDECESAEELYSYSTPSDPARWINVQFAIKHTDRAAALSALIDALPVELAEKEV